MQSLEVIHREPGVDYLIVPQEASYPLTETGIEASLRNVIASWKHRAQGHENEDNAPVAFKFIVSFEADGESIAGGVTLTKTWRKLVGSFGTDKKKAKQAHVLKKWRLIVPPLAPVSVWSVVIESVAANPFVDPVMEMYNPMEAKKTEGCTTLHFLRRRDAMRFVEMSVAVLD
jgi:hypothetical protein